MSFLDNLENTLKNLEGREDKAESAQQRREQLKAEKETAELIQPYVDQLRAPAFVDELLGMATQMAFRKRMMVRPLWIGDRLRLESRDRKLELEPTPDGIVASSTVNGVQEWSMPFHPANPGASEELIARWLESA
jgi:hypothetical protein